MTLREALDELDKAAAALDAAWRNASSISDRDRLRSLILKNDRERIDLINRILAGNQAQYQALAGAFRNAATDIRWAHDSVGRFAVTAGQAAAIVSWAVSLLALL